MNEFEPGIFNSGLVLNYLLRKRSSFTLYLEDGAKLSGTLLGWDTDFLLVRDGKLLQMIQIKKIVRIQAELEHIIAMDSVVIQDNNSTTPTFTEPTNPVSSSKPKFKPALTEVKMAPRSGNEDNQDEPKDDFKDRLDQLVKNW